MANVFDQFDVPAAAPVTPGGNVFDQFDASPPSYMRGAAASLIAPDMTGITERRPPPVAPMPEGSVGGIVPPGGGALWQEARPGLDALGNALERGMEGVVVGAGTRAANLRSGEMAAVQEIIGSLDAGDVPKAEQIYRRKFGGSGDPRVPWRYLQTPEGRQIVLERLGDAEGTLRTSAARAQRSMAFLPGTKGHRKLTEDQPGGTGLVGQLIDLSKTAVQNPHAILEVGAESAPSMVPTIIGSVLAGPAGAAIGAGLPELAGSTAEAAQREGVDLRDALGTSRAFRDRALRERVGDFAAKRALAVAAAGGIGSRLAAGVPGLAPGSIANKVAAGAAGSAVDVGGEAAAQMWSQGHLDARDLFLEAGGGLPFNIAEAAARQGLRAPGFASRLMGGRRGLDSEAARVKAEQDATYGPDVPVDVALEAAREYARAQGVTLTPEQETTLKERLAARRAMEEARALPLRDPFVKAKNAERAATVANQSLEREIDTAREQEERRRETPPTDQAVAPDGATHPAALPPPPTKQAPPDVIQLGQARAPSPTGFGSEAVTTGTGDPGTQAGVESYLAQRMQEATQAQQAMDEAFRLAAARRERYEGAVAQDAPRQDMRPGGRPEGIEPLEEFTFLDPVIQGGQMVSGQRVTPVGGTADGKVVIEMEDGSRQEVDAKRLKAAARPAGPRMAQEFMAASVAPRRGTGALNPGPERATDRIGSRQAAPVVRGGRSPSPPGDTIVAHGPMGPSRVALPAPNYAREDVGAGPGPALSRAERVAAEQRARAAEQREQAAASRRHRAISQSIQNEGRSILPPGARPIAAGGPAGGPVTPSPVTAQRQVAPKAPKPPSPVYAKVQAWFDSGRPLDVRAIAKEGGETPKQVRRALDRLVGLGLATKDRTGRYQRKGQRGKGGVKNPDVFQHIAMNLGGISDPGGELRNLDLHRVMVPGAGQLVRPKGMSPDYVREDFVQRGLLPEGADINALFELLERHHRGGKDGRVFVPSDGRVTPGAVNEHVPEKVQEERDDRRAESQQGEHDQAIGSVAAEMGVELTDAEMAEVDRIMREDSDATPADAIVMALERVALQTEAEIEEGTRDAAGAEDIPFDVEPRAPDRDRGDGRPTAEAGSRPDDAPGGPGEGSDGGRQAGKGERFTELTDQGEQPTLGTTRPVTDKDRAESAGRRKLRPAVEQDHSPLFRDMDATPEAAERERRRAEPGLFGDDTEGQRATGEAAELPAGARRIGQSAAAVDLTPEARAKAEPLVRRVTAAVQQIFPNARVEFVGEMFGWGRAAAESAGRGAGTQRALGYSDQARNFVAVSLAQDPATVETTAVEEAFELAYPMLTAAERAVLASDLDAAGGRSAKEQASQAFARWWTSQDAAGLSARASQAFRKVRAMFQRVGNALRGLGFTSVDDVFRAAASGDVARRGDVASQAEGFALANPNNVAAALATKAGRGALETEVDRWADHFRRTGEESSGALSSTWSKAKQAGRALGWTAGGQMHGVAERTGSKTAQEFAYQFSAFGGKRGGRGATFDEARSARTGEFMNRLDKAIGDLRMSDAAMEQVGRLVRNPSRIRPGTPIHDAAKAITKLLEDMHDYGRAAGINMGDVRAGYLPRVVDAAKVEANPAKFELAARRLFMSMGETAAQAQEHAENWRKHIMGLPTQAKGDFQTDFLALVGSPANIFTKGRTLPDNVDKTGPLAEFYHQNVGELLPDYVMRMSSAAEWTRRMGANLEKWGKAKDAMIAEGVGTEDMATFVDALQAITGVRPRTMSAWARNNIAWIRTFNTIGLLERATLTSLSEMWMPFIRSGDVTELFKGPARTVAALMRRNDPSYGPKHLAEDLGLIMSDVSETMMQNRFGLYEPGSKWRNTVEREFYKRTMLTDFTRATRVASLSTGQAFIRRAAVATQEGGKLGTTFLEELGVPAAEQGKFATWLMAQSDGRPNFDQINSGKAMGALYRDALSRFVDQVVMRPSAATKPAWATTPWGSMVFAIQSYLWAFHHNVLMRGARMAREATREGYTASERIQLALPAALAVTILPLAQLAIGTGRDLLFQDPELWREQIQNPDQMVAKAFSRAGTFGILDPLVNMATSVKYGRSAAQTLAGPYLGRIGDIFDRSAQMFVRNSERTQTAERNLAKMVYDVAFEPIVNLALARLPAGVVTGLATQTVGAGPVREAAVTAIAGKAEPRRRQGAANSNRGGGLPQLPKMPKMPKLPSRPTLR